MSTEITTGKCCKENEPVNKCPKENKIVDKYPKEIETLIKCSKEGKWDFPSVPYGKHDCK